MSEESLTFQLPNGLRGDPIAYLPLKRLGEAICFDLGSLENLTHRELMKIQTVFVSHTHMDHFIGFDRLLRIQLPHGRKLRLWGPAPFIDRVQAKLRSYTWNLIKPEQIQFHVYELYEDGTVGEAQLTNSNHFAFDIQKSEHSSQRLWEWSDGSFMKAALLDHKGIPSVAYQYQIPGRMRVHPEKIAQLGLTPGDWVSQLQSSLRNGQKNSVLEIQGTSYRVEELAKDIIVEEPDYRLSYLTDVSFDAANVAKLKTAFFETDYMLSECSFMDRDVKRAWDKAHLTSRHAALFASLLAAKQLDVFHFSAIYGEDPQTLLQESQEYFAAYRSLDQEGLEKEIQAELQRIASL